MGERLGENPNDYKPDESFESENLNPDPNLDLRRSQREPKPKTYDDYVTYMCHDEKEFLKHGVEYMEKDPETVKEALSRPDSDQWRKAINTEFQFLEENDAWDLVEAPNDKVIVDSKWVFKINSAGKLCFRARLVARGFTQREGIGYDQTFAPVVRHNTLRLCL